MKSFIAVFFLIKVFLTTLILLLIIITAGWASNIMFYVLSDRNDSGGWYTDPRDTIALMEPVQKDGHTVKVEDKTTIKEMSLVNIEKYDQVWILEGDEDSNVEVSTNEADALYTYYKQGHVIWISTEVGAWAEDTTVFMNRFDVDVDGVEVKGPASPPIQGEHPLLNGIKTLKFDDGVGALIVKNPDVKVIWQYPSNSGKKDAIAILDKEGFAVFDSGWVSGYAYRPEAQGDSNIQFAINIARTSSKLAVESAIQRLANSWGNIKNGL